jgi:hypothetical protein
MGTRARSFVVSSLLVVAAGIGIGLVAYYAGLPIRASSQQERLDELQLVPRDATLLAYASVTDVMASDLRRSIRRVVPLSEDAQRELEKRTGISMETDVDYVVACVAPAGPGTEGQPSALVLARGRFDEARIAAVMRQYAANVESHNGSRILVVEDMVAAPAPSGGAAEPARTTYALTFIEPGLVAIGSVHLVRGAIDLKRGGSGVTSNQEMMDHVRSLDTGNVWAVGRFDELASHTRLPLVAGGQLPSITWFSLSGSVDAGVRGMLKAETRDEEAAAQLRDAARGFISLLKLQVSGSRPEMQAIVDSLELGGAGTTVALSFSVPALALDWILPEADELRGP